MKKEIPKIYYKQFKNSSIISRCLSCKPFKIRIALPVSEFPIFSGEKGRKGGEKRKKRKEKGGENGRGREIGRDKGRKGER